MVCRVRLRARVRGVRVGRARAPVGHPRLAPGRVLRTDLRLLRCRSARRRSGDTEGDQGQSARRDVRRDHVDEEGWRATCLSKSVVAAGTVPAGIDLRIRPGVRVLTRRTTSISPKPSRWTGSGLCWWSWRWIRRRTRDRTSRSCPRTTGSRGAWSQLRHWSWPACWSSSQPLPRARPERTVRVEEGYRACVGLGYGVRHDSYRRPHL